MFDRIFANYLADSGKLTKENLTCIFKSQEQKRVRLGVIAVSEKLMTNEQANEVNQLQAICDKRFGDIAIEKGYLTPEQVNRLLSLQGNSYLAFVQSSIDGGYLTMEEIDSMLSNYQQENSLTLMDLEALKSCDIDRIIPIFMYQQPELLTQLVGVMIRTLSRLVDYHVSIKNPYCVDEVGFRLFCMQELKGEHKILTSFCGDSDIMKKIAIGFTKEEFIEEVDDTLDALCELINCVNGLLASDLSRNNMELDMEAPYYQTTKGVLRGNALLCLPIVVYDMEIDLVLALDQDYSVVKGEE